MVIGFKIQSKTNRSWILVYLFGSNCKGKKPFNCISALRRPPNSALRPPPVERTVARMENGKDGGGLLPIIQIYADFMTGVTKFEELGTLGSKLLVSFQQALGFLRRPPVEKTSTLFESIIKAHGTKRFLSYVEAGCKNIHDNVQNVSKSGSIVSELERLLGDAASIVQTTEEQDEDVNSIVDSFTVFNSMEEVSSSDISKPKVTDFASTMAIIYSMVKQDYTMQDRIVTSLNLKSSPSELETYCLMWSLRPFIDDDIMQQAWSLVPWASGPSK